MSFRRGFKRIGVVGKPGIDNLGETLTTLIDILGQHKAKLKLADDCAILIPHQQIELVPRDQIGQDVDLVIVVGGDGSLLNAARAVVQQDIPILGVNRGRLGFLTDICPTEMSRQIPEILAGQYSIEPRAMLQAEVRRQGTTISQGTALNDVVLYSGDIARMIEFEVYIDDGFVYRQRSDGLITTTPTGSTAYALSGGGPIMHPGIPSFALVPMHPHTLSSRPIVISDDSVITLKVTENNTHFPKVSCDGQIHLNTQPMDEIHIRKCSKALKLIHPEGHDYYAVLRDKLGWVNQR